MELTANAPQAVAAGANVLFTDTVIPGNCAILHRDDSGLVNLRGITNQCRARFKVTFGGNIGLTAGTPGAIGVAISINGEPIVSTNAVATIAALNNYFHVSTSTYIDVPTCSNYTVSITNSSEQVISVQNANLIVERTV